MAMLSPELNRFLGCALLDASMWQSIIGGNRVNVIQSFDLQPEERSRILTSTARTLPELSRELASEFALPDAADAEAEIDHFYQFLHQGATTSVASYQGIVQRAINGLPDAQIAANADRLSRRIAS
jgi:hypothetical protein